MVTGLLIQAGALAWIALIADPSLAYSELVVPMVLGGVGISMAIPAAQNSVVGAVALEAVGKAAGTNSMMRELGGVFGIAVTRRDLRHRRRLRVPAGVHRRLRPRDGRGGRPRPRWARWPARPCPGRRRAPALRPAFEETR